MHVLPAEMVEQPRDVAGIELRGGLDGEIVVGLADTAMVEDHRAVVLREVARQMALLAVAECAPAPHAESGRSLAMNLVVHLVTIDCGYRHAFPRCFFFLRLPARQTGPAACRRFTRV